jgi:hypothetical protein
MKNIAIVSFLVLALSACSGDAAKCEGNCADSTQVVVPAVDSTLVDSTAVATATAETATVSVETTTK